MQELTSQQRFGRIALCALLAAVALSLAGLSQAEPPETQPPIEHFKPDLHDKTALRNGAVYFMHQCSGCHSLRGARYSELTKPLGLTRKQISAHIDLSAQPIDKIIRALVPASVSKAFLGTEPPDLTVAAKRRGSDWLYTYLKSFYLDPSRPTGVNNVVFHNVAMPDVFANLQGLQAPVKQTGFRSGKKQPIAVGVHSIGHGSLTPAQFDRMVGDIVTFLDYVAHPHQLERHRLGPWILGLCALLTVFCYGLYRSYWSEVVGAEGRWWTFWKRQ